MLGTDLVLVLTDLSAVCRRRQPGALPSIRHFNPDQDLPSK
jgi:hypothetical protein